MGMRIGGLASGIDTDTIIKDLMKAERIPLDKMEQEKTKMEWQRDAYRDINTKIEELEKSLTQLQLSSTFNTKTVSSSMGSAVTATAGASADDGNYSISVSQLATNEIYSITTDDIDPNAAGFIDVNKEGTYKFYTFNANGNPEEHEIELKDGDSLNNVLDKMKDASDNRVRAYYVEDAEEQDKIVFETTRTGNYNENGNEIIFDSSKLPTTQTTDTEVKDLGGLLTEKGLSVDNIEPVKTAKDAIFKYNDFLDLTSKENSYTLNGVTFEFNSETGDKSANLKVSSDVDGTVEKIEDFLGKYNELIELLNGTQQEEVYRDYPPLTEAQKEDMEEHEIELWEEKAKSGLLRNDGIISSSLFELRSNWYETVDTGDQYDLLTEIGITTTRDYLDGGKLEIADEKAMDKLKEALTKDPEAVQKLFAGSGEEKGLIDRLDDSLNSIMTKIEERAGKGSEALQTYTLGKQMDSLQDRIAAFEDRLTQTEDRYWRQFTAMEQAISRMNNQSSMLMSFGGQ